MSSAIQKLKSKSYLEDTKHRISKYLNNIIEQDHRSIKKRHEFYRSMRTASNTIKGRETIHALYRKRQKDGNLFAFSACSELKQLMGIPA